MTFEQIFGSASHSSVDADKISLHRRRLGGKLFFDRLLEQAGIVDVAKTYPSKSPADLRTFYGRINSAVKPILYRQSFVYYLLLDLRQDAETYARAAGLPQKYSTLIEGFWLLDNLEFSRAVTKLTAPNLIPTFAEETLSALCDHAKGDPSLVLSYFYAVSPDIKDSKVLDRVFSCICQSSVTEAFFFSRQWGGDVHRHLMGNLLSTISSMPVGPVKARMGEELVYLPLTTAEEAWLQEYLTTGDGNKLPDASDFLTMRLILAGKTEEAAETVENATKGRTDGVGWGPLIQNAHA